MIPHCKGFTIKRAHMRKGEMVTEPQAEVVWMSGYESNTHVCLHGLVSKLTPKNGDVLLVRAQVADHPELCRAIEAYQRNRQETFTWLIMPPETSVEHLDPKVMEKVGWVRKELLDEARKVLYEARGVYGYAGDDVQDKENAALRARVKELEEKLYDSWRDRPPML